RHAPRVRARRLSAHARPGGGARRPPAGARPRNRRRLRVPGGEPRRAARAHAEAGRRGEPLRRHRGGDPAPARALRARDGSDRRVLPLDPRQRRRHPRGAIDRGGLPRDPGLAPVGGGARVIIRKSQQEIEGMARAGGLVHETLQLVAEHLEPGVSMLELDRIADEHIASKGGYPTSKGYKGFPAAPCISPNSMVVHGIPNGYRAREGDLISVDLGVTLDGLVADSAVTLPVG